MRGTTNNQNKVRTQLWDTLYVVNIKLHCIVREIGILIVDFSFPEEETSRAQHLSLALYSSSKAESNLGSCDKYEVLHFHPSLGFEDAQLSSI